MNLPILYTVEHASHSLGGFKDRVALSDVEALRFSDYGAIETVPRHAKLIAGTHSRAIIDLNRHPEHPDLYPTHDFSKPKPKKVWRAGRQPTSNDKEAIFERIYKPYHENILHTVNSFKKIGIVIAWHNTAHYSIGKNRQGKNQMMVPFILSDIGDAGRADSESETTSCPPKLLTTLADNLANELSKHNLPNEIALNMVFKGGYTTEYYNTRRHPELDLKNDLFSLQVEYDTLLTHNQKTLTPDIKAINNIRVSFERAMEKTYLEMFA